MVPVQGMQAVRCLGAAVVSSPSHDIVETFFDERHARARQEQLMSYPAHTPVSGGNPSPGLLRREWVS